MRLIFLGSGEFGLPTLRWLHTRHEVAAVVTQPDRPAGRHRRPTPTAIAQWALQASLRVIPTEDVNCESVVSDLAKLRADASVVVAFGQKLSPRLIDVLGRLTVNLHASLLPKYRGAAPINWAMIQGERETGVSVIALAQRMDAGDIYASVATPIDPMETAGELHDRLAEMGPDAIRKTLEDLEAGSLSPVKQDESLASRAPKLSKADGWVDLTADAETIRCRVHGLTPWPGVWVRWRSAVTGHTQPLKLLRVAVESDATEGASPGRVLKGGRVATGRGVIRLVQVQPPGRRVMSLEAFAAGHALVEGDQLCSGPPQ